MKKVSFSGSWVALVTPFRDGAIDKKALDQLVDFHLEKHTDGMVICGTTAESPVLTTQEKKDIFKWISKRVNGRIPLVWGTGGNNTAQAVELSREAADLGADGLLVVTPYYNKPTQAGLIAHFQKIASATPLQIILYNVPGRTGVNMTAATTLELAKVPNITAIKEASGNLDQIMDILAGAPQGFELLSGDDPLNLAIMALGGRGVISVTANIVPDRMKAFTDAALAGKWDEARKLHFELLELHRAMFLESNPIPVKTALSMMGLLNDEFRLPLVGASPQTREKLGKILEKMGVIR